MYLNKFIFLILSIYIWQFIYDIIYLYNCYTFFIFLKKEIFIAIKMIVSSNSGGYKYLLNLMQTKIFWDTNYIHQYKLKK